MSLAKRSSLKRPCVYPHRLQLFLPPTTTTTTTAHKKLDQTGKRAEPIDWGAPAADVRAGRRQRGCAHLQASRGPGDSKRSRTRSLRACLCLLLGDTFAPDWQADGRTGGRLIGGRAPASSSRNLSIQIDSAQPGWPPRCCELTSFLPVARARRPTIRRRSETSALVYHCGFAERREPAAAGSRSGRSRAALQPIAQTTGRRPFSSVPLASVRFVSRAPSFGPNCSLGSSEQTGTGALQAGRRAGGRARKINRALAKRTRARVVAGPTSRESPRGISAGYQREQARCRARPGQAGRKATRKAPPRASCCVLPAPLGCIETQICTP